MRRSLYGVFLLPEAATAQTGSLEEPIDAGQGPEGVVARWQMELDLAGKDEKFWRERAADVNARCQAALP